MKAGKKGLFMVGTLKRMTNAIVICGLLFEYGYVREAAFGLDTESAAISTQQSSVQTKSEAELSETALVSVAQDSNKESQVQDGKGTSPIDGKRLFLWKAVRDKQIVYLLGTIHVVKPNFYPIPAAIDNAFAESQELFVECIPNRAQIQDTLKEVNEKHAYKDGDKLSNHLSAKTKKVFEDYLEWAGEPADMYENYKASQVSSMIGLDATTRYGLKSPGLDSYFINKAKQAHKQITELESIDFQKNMLSSFSDEEQDAQLLSTLLSLKDLPYYLDALMAAWRAGDSDRLEQILKGTQKELPDLKSSLDKVITVRNQGMANSLERYLKDRKDGTYFVAVGAAHVVGDSGLTSLLAREGFSVSQMIGTKDEGKVSFGGSKLERLYYPDGKFSILLPGPASPSVYGTINGLKIVQYSYSTFAGNYDFGYITLPDRIFDPVKVQNLYDAMGVSIAEKMSSLASKSLAAKSGAPASNIKVISQKTENASANKSLKNSDVLLGSKIRSGKNQKLISAEQIKMGPIFQTNIDICKHPGREIRVEFFHNNKAGIIRLRLVLIDRLLYMMSAAGQKAWVDSQIVNTVMNSLTVR